MNNWPVHYRLRDIASGPGVEIILERYIPIAETPKGYWVVREHDVMAAKNPWYAKQARRWVPKDSPRFCSPNIPTAQYSFEWRKNVQLRKLRWQLQQCEQAIAGLKALGDEHFPSTGLDCGVPEAWRGVLWE
jgi:hypothetical protein